ncbi:MAG: MFS transporter [Akkermansiaceae bacterium]|nr:MFS transporter [Akkermansiaceae bacterium]
MRGREARRAITHLTLIAGFASTLFWPLTGWMIGIWGWRVTYAACGDASGAAAAAASTASTA